MIPRVLTLVETPSIPSPCCKQDLMPPAPCRSLLAHPSGRNWDAGGSGCHQPVLMAGIRSRSSDTCDRGVLPLSSLFQHPAFPKELGRDPGTGDDGGDTRTRSCRSQWESDNSGSARVFWGHWHRRVPAPGSASSIRLSLYISLPPLPAPRVTVCGLAAAGIMLLFPSAPAVCQHKAMGLGIAEDLCNRSTRIAVLSKIWEDKRCPALV